MRTVIGNGVNYFAGGVPCPCTIGPEWTRVDPIAYHNFHGSWLCAISAVLNNGKLPSDFYSLIDRTIRPVGMDLLPLSWLVALLKCPSVMANTFLPEFLPVPTQFCKQR